MVIPARRCKTKGGPGFTLLELLLVVALLLGLLGALVYNFGPMQTGANLDEGARQFEALVRFAGADAANSGRAVQFRFEETSTTETFESKSSLRVMREVDPVGQPGVFEDAREAQPFLAELMERIRVVEVKGGERPANQGTNELAEADGYVNTMPPITFFPDGSSDSATIVIRSLDELDLRQMTIQLTGVTGGIRTETKIITEFAATESTEEKDPDAEKTEGISSAPKEGDEMPTKLETISTNEFFFDDFPE